MTGPDTFWIIHGVVRAASRAPIDASKHTRVAFDDLAALLSPCRADESSDPLGRGAADEAALVREAEAALAHNALLTAYAVETDVAPIRYGAAASGPAAAIALLSKDAAHYRRVLDRVSGAVEYALRLTQRVPRAEAEPAPATGGRAYLAAQRSRRDARSIVSDVRAAVASDLGRDLSTVARELAPMPARADRLLDVAILLPRGSVGALVRIAEAFYDRAGACGLDLSLIGPWPTYSFTQIGDDAPTRPAT